MTGTDKAIRWSTVAAVAIVALVAAFVSYRHALDVVRLHGEGWPVAQLYPLTIDGLIYAASMVLLDAARRGTKPPTLAYVALGLGVTATLAANVAAGLSYGIVGAVVAAWPAPALVISYELLMLIIRRSASAPESLPERAPRSAPDPAPVPLPERTRPERERAPGERTRSRSPKRTRNAPVTARDAETEFMAELAAGAVPSIRQIRARLHVGQDRARQLHGQMEALVSVRT
jgi:hypothetical protein